MMSRHGQRGGGHRGSAAKDGRDNSLATAIRPSPAVAQLHFGPEGRPTEFLPITIIRQIKQVRLIYYAVCACTSVAAHFAVYARVYRLYRAGGGGGGVRGSDITGVTDAEKPNEAEGQRMKKSRVTGSRGRRLRGRGKISGTTYIYMYVV